MGKFRLDFWHKDFYHDTALGRTVTGKNKTGQALTVIGESALSFIPLIGKPLTQITGKIADTAEAAKIGKEVHELNLSQTAIRIIKLLTAAGIIYAVITKTLSVKDAQTLFHLITSIFGQ